MAETLKSHLGFVPLILGQLIYLPRWQWIYDNEKAQR